MAFNDTLFQLGMDLTRSSTAQKEDLGEIALTLAHSEDTANDRYEGRSNGQPTWMGSLEPANHGIGTHVTIDVMGSESLSDLKTAVATLTRLVDDAGASLQHLHVHPVADSGAISGVAVLAHGHIAFHSRPSAGYAALDVTTFGGSAPHIWTLAAKAVFNDARISVRVHKRGESVGESILSAVLPPRRTRPAVKAVRAKAA
jgi:S-adenosylmethionine decarboxylase